MTWWSYVLEVSGTDSPKLMSDKTEIGGPHFSKWKAGHIPTVDIAAKFARAYRRPVLEAFVAAGFLTAEEARQRPTAAPTFEAMTNEQLADLVRQRLLNRGGERGGDTPAMNQSRGLRVAARTVGEKTPGQKQRDAIESVGEESQGEGPEGGA